MKIVWFIINKTKVSKIPKFFLGNFKVVSWVFLMIKSTLTVKKKDFGLGRKKAYNLFFIFEKWKISRFPKKN